MIRCSWNVKLVIFKPISRIDMSIPLGNCLQMNVARPHWWIINIVSDNGLVLSDNNKPLLSQCWSRSLSPNGLAAMPQWGKNWVSMKINHDDKYIFFSLLVLDTACISFPTSARLGCAYPHVTRTVCEMTYECCYDDSVPGDWCFHRQGT